MLEVAGSASRYYEAPDPNSLILVYRQLMREVQAAVTGSIVIRDVMGSQIDFVRDSAAPPALESGDTCNGACRSFRERASP